jgi:hypothetical protein
LGAGAVDPLAPSLTTSGDKLRSLKEAQRQDSAPKSWSAPRESKSLSRWIRTGITMEFARVGEGIYSDESMR